MHGPCWVFVCAYLPGCAPLRSSVGFSVAFPTPCRSTPSMDHSHSLHETQVLVLTELPLALFHPPLTISCFRFSCKEIQQTQGCFVACVFFPSGTPNRASPFRGFWGCCFLQWSTASLSSIFRTHDICQLFGGHLFSERTSEAFLFHDVIESEAPISLHWA